MLNSRHTQSKVEKHRDKNNAVWEHKCEFYWFVVAAASSASLLS